MKAKLIMHLIFCIVLVLAVGMIAGCKGGDGAIGQAGQNGLPGVDGADGSDGADGTIGATGPSGVTTVVVVNSDGANDLSVAAVHAAKNEVTVSNKTAAISGDDIVIKFDVKVDGTARNDFTKVASASRYAYSEAYNTGTAKPYVSTSIPTTSVSVALGTAAGKYVATIPGIVSSSVGTAPTRFFIRVNDALTNALEASVVAEVNGSPRALVSDQACINCHGTHVWKESSRPYHLSAIGVGACITCHVNKDRGNFMTYVHGIHNSHNMPAGEKTLKTGFTYATTYPGNMQNCSACHNSAESLAAVLDAPVSYTLCISCHDTMEVAAAAPISHATFTAGTDCSGCHNGSFAFAKVGDRHIGPIVAKGKNQDHEKGKEISMEITDVLVSGSTVTVKWKAFNPLTSAEYDPCNAEADIAGGPVFFNTGANNLALLFGFAQGNDWVNAGVGTAPGQSVSGQKLTTANTTCTGNVATSTVTLPANSATKAIVGLLGKPHVTNTATSTGTSRARVPSPTREFMVADGSLPADLRRNIVDTAKCLACHTGTLYQHGGDRVDNTKLCVICHNPASNEKGNRMGMNVTPAEAYDGREGQTFDLRTMIHSIHSSGVTGAPLVYYRSNGIYFFGSEDSLPATWPGTGSQTVYGSDTDLTTGATVTGATRTHNFHQVTYPRALNDCEACHVAGSYNVPDQAKAVAVTDQNPGADPWGNQLDDVLRGPAAAACMSCHQSTDKLVQASLRQHASQMGWTPQAFTNGRADILNGEQIEMCVVCHGN